MKDIDEHRWIKKRLQGKVRHLRCPRKYEGVEERAEIEVEKMPTRPMRKQQENIRPMNKSHSDWANTHKDGPVRI